MSGRVVRSGPDHQGRKPRTLTGTERNASTPEKPAGGKQDGKHPIKPSTRTQLRRTGAGVPKQRTNAKANGKAAKAGTARNISSQGAQHGSATGRNASGGASGPRRRTPYKSSTSAGNARNARSAGAVAAPGQRRSVSGNAGGGRRTVESHGGVAAGGRVSRSEPGSFVDARQLASEDLVAKTLRESSGTFGMAARPKVVDFTARAKERKRVNARIIIGRIIIAVVSVLAVIGLGWLLLFSPALQLNSAQISVEGLNGWVSESEVRSLAVEQVDRSLLLVDTAKIASQARDIPGVSDAKVSRAFPHGLTISLTTQRPAAMLKTPSGTVAAVDSQYRVLNVISQSDSVGIPVIEVGDIESSVKNRSVKEAVKILDSLSESMRKQITKVSAKTQDSVTTELNDGEHSVVWGDSSDIELKKADVDKILSDPNVIGDKKQVDVSSPYHPVLR